MNLKFQKAIASDKEYLLWLRKETMNEHLMKAGFEVTEENHHKALEYQYEGAELIMHDDENIGLLKKQESDDTVEIIQIQIDPKYQGQGIGKQVVNSVIAKAFSNRKVVKLSVLKDNPAKRLYQNLGFVTIDEDKDSYIMQMEPRQS